jgi:hypothetical protein
MNQEGILSTYLVYETIVRMIVYTFVCSILRVCAKVLPFLVFVILSCH